MNDETLATFVGPTGSLRIGVEGYQFPEISDDDADSNWLIISGDATIDGMSWTIRDPFLTNFEMEHLADWLDKVSSAKGEWQFCCFLEPNLDFERVSDEEVRIKLSHEALGPWQTRNRDFEEIAFNVPIDDRLSVAASSLRALVTRFPIKGRHSS